MVDWLNNYPNALPRDLILSGIFLIAVLVVRAVLVRAAGNAQSLSLDSRRRWIVNIRNSMVVVALIGLVFIWANELRTLALSLVAVAAALAIATKELILCFSGGVWRTFSKVYAIGDRIEVGPVRGDVVDVNLFATTVLELESGEHTQQFTGRSVTFPNSLLLSSPLATEGYTGDYLVYAIHVPLSVRDDWQRAERLLLEIANAECGAHLESAQRHMNKVRRDQGLETPSVEPRVTLELPEPDRINLLLRFPAQRGREGRITQTILHRFLTEFHGRAPPKKELPPLAAT
jgi:small-conductance mechanosensitive channel